MLEGLQATEHSLARSHYWPPRGLLAAGFSPWPGSPLIKQPEPLRLLGGAHVDASLSADAGSTWPDDQQGSLPQAIPQTCLLVAGLQEHATTPGDRNYTILASQQTKSARMRMPGQKQNQYHFGFWRTIPKMHPFSWAYVVGVSRCVGSVDSATYPVFK